MGKKCDKNLLSMTILWIVIYAIGGFFVVPLSNAIAIPYSGDAIINGIMAIVLILFVKTSSIGNMLGLCKTKVSAKKLLWYLPLILISMSSLIFGLKINYSGWSMFFFTILMICVGFLEEVIFRGLLFRTIEKRNIKIAIIVSSVTFGLGHIFNLFNGRGMEILPNALQIVDSIALGFIFVIIFIISGSLFPCILAHSAGNIVEGFTGIAGATPGQRVAFILIRIVIMICYAIYLVKRMGKISLLKTVD